MACLTVSREKYSISVGKSGESLLRRVMKAQGRTMKIEGTNLIISRVEIIKRVFNEKGQVIQENFEFYYPSEEQNPLGFKSKKK